MNPLYLRLWLGVIIALLLSILPMPHFMAFFRPPWVLLLVLYIEYFLPGKLTLILFLLLGLVLDVLLATVIGEHSFAFLLVNWVASTKARRFHFFSITQQVCVIGFLCCLYQSTLLLLDAMLGLNYSMLMPLMSALTSMFLWPWIRLIGDSLFLTRLTARYR